MEQAEESRSRIYWVLHNLRKRLGGFIKRAFKNRPILSIIISLVLVYMVFVSRGSFQPGFLFLRKYYLLVLVILLIFYWFVKTWERRETRGKIITTVLMLLVATGSYFYGAGVYRYVSLYFHYSQINKVELDEFPETAFERIQPINSVRTLINQEGLSETEDATLPRFVRGSDNEYYFTCAVGPSQEYKVQQMTKNMYEVIHIPADLPAPVFSKKYREEVNFDVGELLLFSKKTKYAVVKKFNLLQYFNYEIGSPIYVPSQDKGWLQVVPLIRWKGVLFPRPVFGGVMVIDETTSEDNFMMRILFGEGQYYTPTEIHNIDGLHGQNLIPEKVAKFTAESFRFTNGFFAPLPMYHEGDIRIPSLPNDVDPQPFTAFFNIKNDEKLYNFFGLEPYQENKKGLSLSLFIPGDDDSKVYFIDHRKSNLSYIGSSAISAKIIESKKNYDWTKNYPAESRPFIRNVEGKSRLFWLSTIVTKAGENTGDYIGGSIPEITLTDAVHGKVVWINSDSLIQNDSWIRQAQSELHNYWENE